MTKEYLEQMRAHVEEGGQLNHKNAIDLLAEVEKLKKEIACLRTNTSNEPFYAINVAGSD